MAHQPQEDQLIELLLQLRKTTPDQARTILNTQPQLSYMLINLMVKMNAINVEALQKTLASYTPGPSASAAPVVQPVQTPAPSITPSAIPSHLVSSPQYRTSTPQAVPVPPTALSSYPPVSALTYPPFLSNHTPAPSTSANPYVAPAAPVAGYAGMQAPAAMTDTLGTMPDQQKAMITRIITMSPEDIKQLRPEDRETIIQIRATLGLPTG